MAWTRGSGASGLRNSSGSWFRAPLAARKRWREFAPLRGELVTPDDASHVGLPLPWFQHFVEDHFSGSEVRAEQLRFAIDDPSIRDLLRYKIEQLQLFEEFSEVLDDRLNPYDAIAAGVADTSLAAVAREVFPDQADVSVRELIPEILRRAVRDFLVGKDGRPSAQRVRRAIARARVRQDQFRELEPYLKRRVGIDAAIQSGAADDALHGLARTWFDEKESLSVEQLLLGSHVPAFARVLGWQKMMSNLDPTPASR
ncbi:MAG: hypothetical protein P8R42_23640 [Candidatus Binatia bacterium]|nr:hypothetical protein [Candidatus Binatia bacterium]